MRFHDTVPDAVLLEGLGALLLGLPEVLRAAPRSLNFLRCPHRNRPSGAPAALGGFRSQAWYDYRGGAWFKVGARMHLVELDENQLEHELAHAAGGHTGGPPAGRRAAWTRARADDARMPGAPVCPGRSPYAVSILLTGGPWITDYAERLGEHEDWADAVALYRWEQRHARPVTAGASFGELWPARAALLRSWLGAPALPARFPSNECLRQDSNLRPTA